MWTSWTESAKAALDKTGDALSQAATQAGQSMVMRPPPPPPVTGAQTGTGVAAVPSETVGDKKEEESKDKSASDKNSDKEKDLLASLSTGWSSMLETTKASLKTAQDVLEDQQARLAETIQKTRLELEKRDVRLPFDVAALKDAEVVYVTDRLLTMSHPAMASSVNGDITANRKLRAVAHLLQKRHEGRFMIWNLSEVEYDAALFDNQVLTFSFPGSPSPPLGLLLKLLVSMEAWLRADSRNVAVVHCLTGKGRTSTVLAAFLCWMNQAGFANVQDAMEYIAQCKQLTVQELTIPSQRRYASYFTNMLDGVRPSQPPLMLKRVLFSSAPRYATGPVRTDLKQGMDEQSARQGCAPYLQLFKAGQLLFTAPATLSQQQGPTELPFCQVADGSISFQLNQLVVGDILIRARHLTQKKQRVSMFRAAFHTGYVPPHVMRLTKSQLDGACTDDAHYPDDFYMDLIFEAVDPAEASQLLRQQEEHLQQEAAESTGGGADSIVTASAHDSMLHRDSRFWEVIANRRQAQAQQETSNADGNAAATPSADSTPASKPPQVNSDTWGDVVGRRRDFGKEKKEQQGSAETADTTDKPTKTLSALESFSIGGELDFMPSPEEAASQAAAAAAAASPTKKKDSLMEALMGALEDDTEEPETEEVVFFEESSQADGQQPGGSIDLQHPTDSAAASQTDSGAPSGTVSGTASVASSAKPDSSVDDLLADAKKQLNDEEDEDMDTLLANANTDDLDLGDVDDDDDDDLADLESMLSPTAK